VFVPAAQLLGRCLGALKMVIVWFMMQLLRESISMLLAWIPGLRRGHCITNSVK
jgi:hypothetical protein